jgi:hypothetical protein
MTGLSIHFLKRYGIIAEDRSPAVTHGHDHYHVEASRADISVFSVRIQH